MFDLATIVRLNKLGDEGARQIVRNSSLGISPPRADSALEQRREQREAALAFRAPKRDN